MLKASADELYEESTWMTDEICRGLFAIPPNNDAAPSIARHVKRFTWYFSCYVQLHARLSHLVTCFFKVFSLNFSSHLISVHDLRSQSVFYSSTSIYMS